MDIGHENITPNIDNNTNNSKLFDDVYFQVYKENNNYLPESHLFSTLVTDINNYLLSVINTSNSNQLEYRLGYIIYSKMNLCQEKMHNLLNMLIQKNNPNIRIQSHWEIISSFKGPMEINNNIEIKEFDKIKIKIIIKPNDKDYAIKKLIDLNIKHLIKTSKKANNYLIQVSYLFPI